MSEAASRNILRLADHIPLGDSWWNVLVAVLVIGMARGVLQRYRYIQQLERLPGPSLRLDDKQWVHPFFGHIAPLIQSVGTIPEFPDYPNSLFWYFDIARAFSKDGLARIWAFHPYYVPFSRSAIFIFDAHLAKQLLETKSVTQHLIKAKRIYKIVQPLIGSSLLDLPDGPEWKHQRKLAAASFTQELLEHATHTSQQLLDTQVFPKWWQEQHGSTNPAAPVPIEGTGLCSRLTLEILGHVAFGYAFGGLDAPSDDGDDGEDTLHDTYVRMVQYCAKKARSAPLVHILWRAENAQFRRDCARLDSTVRDVVQRRLDEQIALEEQEQGLSSSPSKTSKSTSKPKDLLGYLVQKDAEGQRLSFDYIFGNVRMLLFAGHDTTSSVLSNTLWHLATHPDAQTQLQAELDPLYDDPSTDNKANNPTYKQLKSLRYLDAVIRESLRLYSPVVIGRTSTVPLTLQGRTGQSYPIPAGTAMLVMPFLGHMCQAYWGENAQSFCPERFLTEPTTKSTILENGPKTDVWYPFSVGGRNCVGQPLAIAELKSLLVHLLRQYRVEPQEGAIKTPPINTLMLTVKPHQVPIQFVIRQSQSSTTR